MRRRLIVSAVNFTEGGPLSILVDCLRVAGSELRHKYDIIALVHSRSLFRDIKGVRFLEFPSAKRSWWMRLYFEYVYFKRLSKRLQPSLWLSLHDVTPNVSADAQAVYCHNPAAFYRATCRQAFLDPGFWLFTKLYRWVYERNIHKNEWVIVQQEWVRAEFQRRFGVKQVVVGHPSIVVEPAKRPVVASSRGRFRLLFPTFPRVFKNVEVLGEAARLLAQTGIELLVTFSGTENRYARSIAKRYRDVEALKLIGPRTRNEMFALYAEVDGLLFPSKLETWGLPLTEFKVFSKPILVADLPYARETVGAYDKVKFFPPDDAQTLVKYIVDLRRGEIVFDCTSRPIVAPPYASNWEELFALMLT